MKYQVSTNKGDLIVDGPSEYDVRQRLQKDGLSVYSVRSYFGSQSPNYGVGGDNFGDLSIDNTGGFGVGVGGGLVIESDGDLGIQIAPGFSIDTGLDLGF